MRLGKLMLLVVFSLGAVGSLHARQQIDRRLIRSWSQGQQAAVEGFKSFSVQAVVHHAVRTGNGQREAEILLNYSGDPKQPVHRPEVVEFVLNGDTLDTSEGRRVQQGLTSMMSPEIGPLLYGFSSPALSLRRMRLVGIPAEEEVEGETLLRFNFMGSGPEGNPQIRDGSGRPPAGRPNLPGNRRPPIEGRRVPGDGPPLETGSFWFDQGSGRLVMSSSILTLPGNRTLVVETAFERIEGMDVPVWRTVKGSFPIQRRLRTTTVNLEHETAYKDYFFSKK